MEMAQPVADHKVHMSLLPDTSNCGLRMRLRGLAITSCITARAWRRCRDAYWDYELAGSLEFSGGENVPGILDACTTRNFDVSGKRTMAHEAIKRQGACHDLLCWWVAVGSSPDTYPSIYIPWYTPSVPSVAVANRWPIAEIDMH